MKIFPQNNFQKKRKKIWLFVLLIAVASGAINDNARFFVSKTIVSVLSPFFKGVNSSVDTVSDFSYSYRSKKSLFEELNRLKERNAELEKESLAVDMLRKENEELWALFLRMDKKDYVLSNIISRPPKSPFDMLVIDVGSENGVQKDMKVVINSEIMIGYIVDVFSKTSKVKLISFPGEETGVFIEIGDKNILAKATGLGGGNMEIKIPASIEMVAGAKIMAENAPVMIGAVEEIEIDPINPFQKILFHLPVNLNEIRKVLIEK